MQGNILITVESEGVKSEAKSFFIGIPISVLSKMPVLGFRNTFNVYYIDGGDGNKEKNYAASFERTAYRH